MKYSTIFTIFTLICIIIYIVRVTLDLDTSEVRSCIAYFITLLIFSNFLEEMLETIKEIKNNLKNNKNEY